MSTNITLQHPEPLGPLCESTLPLRSFSTTSLASAAEVGTDQHPGSDQLTILSPLFTWVSKMKCSRRSNETSTKSDIQLQHIWTLLCLNMVFTTGNPWWVLKSNNKTLVGSDPGSHSFQSWPSRSHCQSWCERWSPPATKGSPWQECSPGALPRTPQRMSNLNYCLDKLQYMAVKVGTDEWWTPEQESVQPLSRRLVPDPLRWVR